MTLLEFAIKYNTDANELLELLVFEGFPINTIDDEIDDRLIKYLLEFAGIDQKKGSKKKSKHKSGGHSYRSNIKEEKPVSKQNILYEEKMTIAECVEHTDFSAAAIINFFLKKNKLYSIHSLLTVEEVAEFAAENNIKLIKKVDENNQAIVEDVIHAKNTQGGNFKRNPIVTIVGHVDHGKTTLLDKIRQENVAQNEKGGITQHIGAYEIKYNNQDITFIDTPGHEAFNALRERGITIADIGILVVAADDGVKPQTIESIKILQEMKIEIIIALTKIDKKNRKTTEAILNELHQYGILTTMWGGEISIVELSAFTGEGISTLLETITIMAELADLKTNTNTDAFGYILETKKDKGLGFVSTIILQKGKLQIGDAYYTSTTWGKVIVAYNSAMQKVSLLYPGKPYIINGFDNLPIVGSFLAGASLHDAKRRSLEMGMQQSRVENKQSLLQNEIPKARIKNIIIKADVFSSLQAIEKNIAKYVNDANFYYKPNILSSGIGEITENDIIMAIHSNAVIYLFNTPKINNQTLVDMIKKNNVQVLSFDIIYGLFDHLEAEIKEEKNKEPILNKIGEVQVLKLFNIKNVGLIIGFKVLQGIVKLGATGKVISNKIFVSKGIIKSLEKEKHQVKELTKGHEGALLLSNVNNVLEGDIIEIYTDK
jgi:translation initiation factor IF-2